jgi:hypothetical protein
MRSITTAMAIAGTLAIPLHPAAQKPFEGSVTYRMEADGSTIDMVHYVKDDNIRVELDAGANTMIIITNLDASKQIAIMPERRQWMDLKAMQERMASMMGNAADQTTADEADPTDFEIQATGQKETIAGHECEHYIYSTSDGETDVCAAKGLGWYFGNPAGGAMGGMSGGMGAMMGGRGNNDRATASLPGLSNKQREQWQKLYADGFFPLKVTHEGRNGAMSLIVTAIEQKSLADDLFTPPPGYSEMKIGGNP